MRYASGIKNPLGMKSRSPGLPRKGLTHADAKKDFTRQKLKKVVQRFTSGSSFVAGSAGEIVGSVKVTGKGTDGGYTSYPVYDYYNLYKRTYEQNNSTGQIRNDTGYSYHSQVQMSGSTMPADYCEGVFQIPQPEWSPYTCWWHSGPFTAYDGYAYSGSPVYGFGLTFPGGGDELPALVSGPFYVALQNGKTYSMSLSGGSSYIEIEYMVVDKG
jgi:hypothetical protein